MDYELNSNVTTKEGRKGGRKKGCDWYLMMLAHATNATLLQHLRMKGSDLQREYCDKVKMIQPINIQ